MVRRQGQGVGAVLRNIMQVLTARGEGVLGAEHDAEMVNLSRTEAGAALIILA